MNPLRVFFFFGLLLFSLFVKGAFGWNCRGHMLVAEIARRHLSEANREKVEWHARGFSESGPFPNSGDFVQSACWLDDLKSWHFFSMKGWHYVDLPFSPDNTPVDRCMEEMNVITASESMIIALRKEKSPAYVHNFALVSLVHFIGDIHQPLHATTRYTHRHPHGDAGGNAFIIYVDQKELNLHSLWDNICIPHDKGLSRPLSDDDYTRLKAYADHLEDTYKFDSALLKEENIKTFAQESHAFGVNTTYAGIKEGEEVSEEYLTRCRSVTEARLTLAGRRLANILNKLLDHIELKTPLQAASLPSPQRLVGGENKHRTSTPGLTVIEQPSLTSTQRLRWNPKKSLRKPKGWIFKKENRTKRSMRVPRISKRIYKKHTKRYPKKLRYAL